VNDIEQRTHWNNSGDARRKAPSPARAAASSDASASVAYLTLAGLFVGVSSLALVWLRRHQRLLPRARALDLFLLSMGTARLSRLITRDKVMRPLRAPFTVTEAEPSGELRERAGGSGWTRAAGELITCPRCTAVWAASGLTVAYYATANAGRFASLVLSSALISDFTNRGLAMLNEWGSEPSSGATAPR
jgi:hypothetical protein